MTSLPLHTVRGACPHDCPDTCAWQVTVESGRATKLVGDVAHPITRGGLCAKVNHFLDRVYSDQRILHPLRRTGPKGSGQFERVSWDEALSGIAAGMRERIDRHGPTTVLPFSYLGTQGLLQASSLDLRFFARLGATRLTRAVCAWTGSAGTWDAIGTNLGIVPEEIVHSRYIILWGTNTVVTNLHLWPLIREARANGATVVVIDPAATRTARAADWHIQPLPGTDSALALGLMHLIVRDGLHDADYIAQHTTGFEAMRERLLEYPPERVAAITGIPEEDLARLALAYASTQPSCIRLLVGMEHRGHGAETYRTIAYLPAITGAWRQRGGGLLFLTAGMHFGTINGAAVQQPEREDRSIREVNMVQIGKTLTDPALDPPITALIVYSGNPAVTMPNQTLTMAGLARDDLLTVVHEQFPTDTALYADYVLPATTQIEHLDLMWSWGHDYLALNNPAIEPQGEALPTTEFFRRLSRAMGMDEPELQTSDRELIDLALDSDWLRELGVDRSYMEEHGWVRLPQANGPAPYANGQFPTSSGKCEFIPARFAGSDADPLPAWRGDQRPADFPLHLVTGKGALHFLNSSYSHLPWHLGAEGEPTVVISQPDADRRGIRDGDPVEVVNERACLPLRAKIGGVREGVVVIDSGRWARLSPGGLSANALTPDGLSDAGGGGNFHDAFVEVRRSVVSRES